MIFGKLFKEQSQSLTKTGKDETDDQIVNARTTNPLSAKAYNQYLFNDMPIATYQNFPDDLISGYMSNETVYSIINKISGIASSIPIKMYDKNNKEINSHWALDAINNPNEDENFAELYKSILIYYLAVGNGYMYAPKIRSGKTKELWKLPAPYVVAISGGVTNPIKGYRLYLGTQDYTLEKDDIFHFKMFNPRFLDGNFVYGLSPIAVAADIINNLNAGEKRMFKMLEKGIPPFVISAMTHDGLNEQQQQMLEKTYDKKYGTSADPNKPLMSGIQLKVDKLGFSAQDLSIIENSVHGLRVLCNVYGIPSILLNDLSESTYSNYETAMAAFYGDTIMPLNDNFASKLTKFLLSNENGSYFRFDYSTVNVLSKAKVNLMKEYSGISFLTKNEKREIFGLDPLTPEQESLLSFLPSRDDKDNKNDNNSKNIKDGKNEE